MPVVDQTFEICDFYLEESIHHRPVKKCHAFCRVLVDNECCTKQKTRNFFLVKLKNHLYIRHDGVLYVFPN